MVKGYDPFKSISLVTAAFLLAAIIEHHNIFRERLIWDFYKKHLPMCEEIHIITTK